MSMGGSLYWDRIFVGVHKGIFTTYITLLIFQSSKCYSITYLSMIDLVS